MKDNLNVLSAVANSRIKDESVQETEGIDSESMSVISHIQRLGHLNADGRGTSSPIYIYTICIYIVCVCVYIYSMYIVSIYKSDTLTIEL